MAATCEISNIFSNYFSAMYSSEDSTLASVPPAATFGADDLVLTLSNPQMSLEGTEKASWLGEQPQFWSKTQVLDWISYQVEKNKYDASAIDFSRCDMDGATLCNCALEELRLVFGPLGDQLHAQLRDLTSSSSDELSWIIELLEKDGMAFQEALDPGPFDQGSPFAQELLDDGQQASPYHPGSCGAGAPSPGSSDVSTAGTGASRSSHSSDSGGSDVDLDPTDGKLFPSDGFRDCKKGDPKHGKRKRGRPRKLSKEYWDCLEGKKSKHGTTTNGRSWNGWMAGDSSTSLAKTQAAGRRKRFSRVGTEGWNYTRDQTHGPLEACKPSWEDRQARWPLHWGMLPAVLWREADVLVYCQPSSWDSETMASPPHPPLGITSPGV
uniref:E74-like ETS transcription factor 3 isoform 5 n=1 Tax=Homo sapiens TaxID=9606 RepID=A0A8E8V174_HUMAN|nr:E74-like ETS transcription factor 3 isoform 5 [Homo sapiens]